MTEAETATAIKEARLAKPPNWFQIIWSSGKARVGLILLGLFVIMAIAAPLLSPYDPQDGSFEQLLQPSLEHPMGTTSQGYDILAQFLYGARLSLLVGLLGGGFATVLAVVIGLISGYTEGTVVDHALSFVTNLALVVPILPLMMVIVAYSESRGLGLMVFVIGVTSWAGAARAKRAQIITLRSREFVTAAKFSGEGTWPIVFREIMPNMTSLIVSGFIGAATGAIAAEAGLSFLGFGDPQTVSWGQMLAFAQQAGALVQGFWIWLVVPGLALAVLITALTFVNFGVDLISNPHLREN
ncbi:ABC transporter permease [Microlunatus parietis]|uniref:Peptide/nickel transport system permease protein n=1 Tax=Microlunatus parietis TaxID=682979 RepID=A0A7Y9I6T1_9ACTN|nr:ABC transporter permease [Microlunatus parietis]NYE71336.1 peptide/nickel transport system permease protein [Microlunatus parietis]